MQFNFDMQWNMTLANNDPGYTNSFINLSVRLLDADVGGPLANGTLSLFHPDVYDDGYFSLEIVSEYRAAALIDPVPIPGAAWLFGSAVVALAGLRHRVAALTASVSGPTRFVAHRLRGLCKRSMLGVGNTQARATA